MTRHRREGPAGPGEFLAGGRVSEVSGHASHQAVDAAEQEVDFRPVPWPELPVKRVVHAAANPQHLLEQGNRLRGHVVAGEPGHVGVELLERGIADAALLGPACPLARLVRRHQDLLLNERVGFHRLARQRPAGGDNAGRAGRRLRGQPGRRRRQPRCARRTGKIGRLDAERRAVGKHVPLGNAVPALPAVDVVGQALDARQLSAARRPDRRDELTSHFRPVPAT